MPLVFTGSCGRQVRGVQTFQHIPVLCYHHINPSEHLKDNYLNTAPSDFKEHIQFLKESGYVSMISKEIPALTSGELDMPAGKKPVLITFDDGYKSVYDHAYPVLKKYGYRGIVFLITDKIENDCTRMYMNKKQINELIQEGWEIGSHTVTHPKLNAISMENMSYQITGSKHALEKMFGIQVVSSAYPYGIINRKILDYVRENYSFAFTTIQGNNYNFNDLFLMERYLILKTDTLSTFKRNVVSKKLACDINSELYNNTLYIDVSLSEEKKDQPLEVYFNSRLVKHVSAETDMQFKFNYFYEYSNFSLVSHNSNGEQQSITKIIHITRSADVY